MYEGPLSDELGWLDKPCFASYGRLARASLDLPPDEASLRGLPVAANDRVEWLFLNRTTEYLDDQITDMEDGCAAPRGRDCYCTTCAGRSVVDRVVKFIDVCVNGAEVWLNSEFENAPFLKGPAYLLYLGDR